MIRPEFKTILLDQRGAAVILWSCFVISIPIYVVISRSVLANPNVGTNPSIATPARVMFWLLTLVDLGYYVYWRRRNLPPDAIVRDAKATKLFRALASRTIAVYGLVLAIVGRFVQDQYWLSALSVALLVIEFPSEKSLDALIHEAEQTPVANAS